MGESFYKFVCECDGFFICIYVLVGGYKDLFVYLVWCFLENGVNLFFVMIVGDNFVLVEDLFKWLV